MTEATIRVPRAANLNAWLFPVAIFTSATLVFLVQPMLAKMLLPKLGGSPAVWNTSMVFFQAALLIGYGYAHLLQRLRNFKIEAAVHLGALAAASVFLPLAIAGYLGEPSSSAPALWLFAALATSVAAPFAVLSATAPLMQSWYSRLGRRDEAARNPYPLYVASNVGSMLALLAYPLIVEPLLPLGDQSRIWAMGYGVFCALAATVALTIFSQGGSGAVQDRAAAPQPALAKLSARTRLLWIGLAAIPSSLMLGTTTFISTDVAAAPFLWVVPLALYLLTFIVAFQERPMISARAARLGQGLLVPVCLASMVGTGFNWWVVLILHASAFFFSALVCHQALSARRPEPGRLTEFYLCLSVGGVVGGAATALLAPMIFNYVLEYPLVLVLAALARPLAGAKAGPADWGALAVAVICAAVLTGLSLQGPVATLAVLVLLTLAAAAAILLRAHTRLFAAALGAIATAALVCGGPSVDLFTARSFFGVHRVMMGHIPALGGDVHILAHGTTIHGAQPLSPAYRCLPTNYYAPHGAIGQAYAGMAQARPHMRIGVVGLGAGGVAPYTRAGDAMRFFEIDPKVEAIARDRRYFTYLSDCAKGAVDVVIGDARLTLAREPAGTYDLLHLDAFTSDAIPIHLFTVEALDQYLRLLKPDGVLMLHISNRHLALEGIAAAEVERLGAHAIVQNYRPAKGTPLLVENPTDVMLVSRSSQALAPFLKNPGWRPAQSGGAAAWTDDHSDIMTALLAHAFAKPPKAKPAG